MIGRSLVRFDRSCRSNPCRSMKAMDDDVFEMESVEVIGDHAIRLTFADGLIREIDLDYWISGPQGEPLRDPAYFALVKVDQPSATIV
jgi:hypothetical protein